MSQEENQLKFDLVKKIFSEYNPEIVNFLKEKDYKYEILQIQDFSLYQSEKEELSLIEVEPEIQEKLTKLSEITGIPVKDIVSKELGDSFYSVGDIPIIFLDRHLGIENIENPFEMLKKMKDVIHIPEKYIESLKTKGDLMKEIEEWNKPLKIFKKFN